MVISMGVCASVCASGCASVGVCVRGCVRVCVLVGVYVGGCGCVSCCCSPLRFDFMTPPLLSPSAPVLFFFYGYCTCRQFLSSFSSVSCRLNWHQAYLLGLWLSRLEWLLAPCLSISFSFHMSQRRVTIDPCIFSFYIFIPLYVAFKCHYCFLLLFFLSLSSSVCCSILCLFFAFISLEDDSLQLVCPVVFITASVSFSYFICSLRFVHKPIRVSLVVFLHVCDCIFVCLCVCVGCLYLSSCLGECLCVLGLIIWVCAHATVSVSVCVCLCTSSFPLILTLSKVGSISVRLQKRIWFLITFSAGIKKRKEGEEKKAKNSMQLPPRIFKA